MICMFMKFFYCLFLIIIFIKKRNNIGIRIAIISKQKSVEIVGLVSTMIGCTRIKTHDFLVL